jgi:pyridoxal phosphate enzyme (YggS family)
MIKENVIRLLSEFPSNVELVAAAKTRNPTEILEAIEAGIKIIGENYIQEAEGVFAIIGNRVRWHYIGHLQSNKVKKAVRIFDMIETVDSIKIANNISKQCSHIGKIMPILIEINSGREEQKNGVLPEYAERLIRDISSLKNIKVEGLMTMGPRFGNPEDSRSCFVETRKVFEKIARLGLSNIYMKYLSMGMTNSYRVALEEGANMIRIGSKIFGDRF